ncbi:MAG: class I SAM-dependent methyltransferase [Candidatus Aenigmarchaeota archaeon]|nr:class I SAM-dependent methyltransferase [Candidatus Aenigmarchaeota archaeon]
MKQWDKIYKNDPQKYKYYSLLKPHEDMQKVASVFKKHKVKRVLDLGCGSGRNTIFLAKKGFDVYGIDYAEKGIVSLKKWLNKSKLKANLKVGNIYNKFPYENNFFDAIISIQVIQHGKVDQIKNSIKEIERVLKPNGMIFVTVCGRVANGKIRLFLVKTANKIAPNTYVPTQGEEEGLTHYIFTSGSFKRMFKNFKSIKYWKDSKDYYCLLGRKK